MMKELYKSLAAFQQDVPHVYKGTSGYGYKYADWGQILDVVNPLLAAHGLGFTQLLDGTKLTTRLFHGESGESIESSVDIPQDVELKGMNKFQVIGSGITYYRRYSLSAILGLVTDEDKDASGEQVKKQAPKEVQVRSKDAVADPFPAAPDALGKAKRQINDWLNELGYTLPEQKKTFIVTTLGKATVDNLDDADALADAIDNVRES